MVSSPEAARGGSGTSALVGGPPHTHLSGSSRIDLDDGATPGVRCRPTVGEAPRRARRADTATSYGSNQTCSIARPVRVPSGMPIFYIVYSPSMSHFRSTL